MTKVFYKKSTAIAFIAAILVLILLVLILLVTLMQMTSLNQRAEQLAELIADAKKQGEITQELADYLKTDDYVREWATENGRIPSDDVVWLENELAKDK